MPCRRRSRCGALAGTACLAAFASTAAAQQSPALVQRTEELAKLPAAQRVAALTGVADELLFAEDAERAACVAVLRRLAGEGLFYSPSADEPSMLWFQYERAMRRDEVARLGAKSLLLTVDSLRHRRERLWRGSLFPGEAPSLYDLRAFGWHGATEVLEGASDLATRLGRDAQNVGAELAKYLACETPRPSQPKQLHSAGPYEKAPLDTAARKHAILWGDDYRIALARAVLATQPASETGDAVLHLLYSPRREERMDAITRLRAGPLVPDAVPHLVARLQDGDRLVSREAAAALGAGGDAGRAAEKPLRDLAAGTDPELRVVAARALTQLGFR